MSAAAPLRCVGRVKTGKKEIADFTAGRKNPPVITGGYAFQNYNKDRLNYYCLPIIPANLPS